MNLKELIQEIVDLSLRIERAEADTRSVQHELAVERAQHEETRRQLEKVVASTLSVERSPFDSTMRINIAMSELMLRREGSIARVLVEVFARNVHKLLEPTK